MQFECVENIRVYKLCCGTGFDKQKEWGKHEAIHPGCDNCQEYVGNGLTDAANETEQ